jgi:hypothetical protein
LPTGVWTSIRKRLSHTRRQWRGPDTARCWEAPRAAGSSALSHSHPLSHLPRRRKATGGRTSHTGMRRLPAASAEKRHTGSSSECVRMASGLASSALHTLLMALPNSTSRDLQQTREGCQLHPQLVSGTWGCASTAHRNACTAWCWRGTSTSAMRVFPATQLASDASGSPPAASTS